MPQDVILFLAANPHHTGEQELEQQCAAIDHELRLATHRDFEFRPKWALTVDGLMRHLLELRPTIVHFNGTGAERSASGTSGIYLEDDRRRPQFVPAEALTRMIASAAESARVVVLNACYSKAQADAMSRVVDCVVGTDASIPGEMARSFAVGFYRALGERRPVGNAFDQAVATLMVKNARAEQISHCRPRDGVDANAVLLSGPGPGGSLGLSSSAAIPRGRDASDRPAYDRRRIEVKRSPASVEAPRSVTRPSRWARAGRSPHGPRISRPGSSPVERNDRRPAPPVSPTPSRPAPPGPQTRRPAPEPPPGSSSTIPPRAVRSNPYRSLGCFDVNDGEDFFGRGHLIHEAVDVLRQRLGGPAPAAVRIVGESGTGKSSLLRGGVLHALANEPAGEFHVVALRPTDFHGREGQPTRVVRKLMKRICRETEMPAPAVLLDDDSEMTIARTIAAALNDRLRAAGRKLVIGLDQFEEIVDDLDSKRRGAAWQPLLEFIAHAVQGTSVGLVFTLERSRVEIFHRVLTRPAFHDSHCIEVSDLDPQFLREIIDRPFRRAGFRLHGDIIEELLRRIRELPAAGQDMRWNGSVLPLIAVQLTRLFDEVEERLGGRLEATGAVSLGSQFEPNVSPGDLRELDLGFTQVIANLARSAWRNAAENFDVDQDDIGHFLRPLVRLAAPGSTRLRLTTVGERPYDGERRMDDIFRRHGLLVRVGGHRRLVHEAVIHEWPEASQWLRSSLDLLVATELFSQAAVDWDARGRSPDAVPRDADSIDTAATVLNSYLRVAPSTAGPDREHHVLMDYCLAVFRHSGTPTQPVPDCSRGRAHVHLAASYGLVDVLQRFAEREPGCLEHECSVSSRRPLADAAWGQRDAVAFLLDRRVDATAPERHGWRAIVAPIVTGNDEIFKLLLAHCKAGDSLAAEGGVTLLHSCANYDRVEMARSLVRECRLDPGKVDANRWTPMHVAARYGNLGAFKFFRDETAVTDLANGWSALHFAAIGGHVDIVRALLSDDSFLAIDLTQRTVTSPLALASQHRRAEVVSVLLHTEHPGSLQQGGDTPLHLAIEGPPRLGEEYEASREAALRTVRALLEHPSTDPNARSQRDGKSPFERAEKHPRIRRALLEHPRFDVSAPLAGGKTALMIAAEARNRGLVQRILARPEANVRFCHASVSTAVVMLRAGMGDLVRQLVADGRIDPWADSAPMLLPEAIATGDDELTGALLSALSGAPRARTQPALDGALRSALRQQRASRVGALLDLGASPDAPDPKNGQTAVMTALATGRLDLVEPVLARAGTDLLRVDAWGRTALDFAPDALLSLVRDRFPPAVDRGGPSSSVRAAWAPPFYDTGFAPSLQRAAILEALARSEPGCAAGGQPEVIETPLPFYDGARLVHVSDPGWQPASLQLYWVAHPGGIVRLAGASAPIHELNEKCPIRLTQDRVLAYLAFFCFFVHGDDGPFLIVDRLDNPFLPINSPSISAADAAAVRTALEAAYRAPQVHGRDDRGAWRVSALVYYGRGVFQADFVVRPEGLIEMVDDRPLRDAPIAIDAPLAPAKPAAVTRRRER